MEKRPETEEVELFRVFKKDGVLQARDTIDTGNYYELYGFLKILILDIEEGLQASLKYNDEEEE